MSLLNHSIRKYILSSLCCLVLIAASVTFILSLYRLQRDASLLNRERKRDYVTNKINRSFPIIAIIINILVCISSIVGLVGILIVDRSELLIICIISSIILGIGLIVLGVIMLGFVQNIVDNFPVDIERLLVEFLLNNKTSAHDELLMIENSNDCCTTQDLTWIKRYSQAAECNREEKYRMIYADQDERRGCVKIITRTALSLLPVLISEIICGCLCLLLGLWTINVICQNSRRYDGRTERNAVEPLSKKASIATVTKYPSYQQGRIVRQIAPEITVNNDQIVRSTVNSQDIPRRSYPVITTAKSLHTSGGL